jgi:hypothetical protein
MDAPPFNALVGCAGEGQPRRVRIPEKGKSSNSTVELSGLRCGRFTFSVELDVAVPKTGVGIRASRGAKKIA